MENGRFAANLIALINGRTPDSVPGWRTIDDADCRVWSNVVHAIVDFRWSGNCRDGYASGLGLLTVSYVLKGNQVTYIYSGPKKTGRITGIGTERWEGQHPEKGNRYHGAFVDGIRYGLGTYSSPGFGRLEGEFRAGKPNGSGNHYDSRGRLQLSGNFKAGCLKSGSKRVFVFTTKQACGF
ncbi:MAG: hypothetical protein GY789_26510 [Hyphomicrobiales bacterium]|nr:hypothetical protein [Hyphomicrobiales bacterium]